MREKLEKLDEKTLKKIALDISIRYQSQKKTAKLVAEYYCNYGLRWIDLAKRYNLE